jgi:hypothetical protein
VQRGGVHADEGAVGLAAASVDEDVGHSAAGSAVHDGRDRVDDREDGDVISGHGDDVGLFTDGDAARDIGLAERSSALDGGEGEHVAGVEMEGHRVLARLEPFRVGQSARHDQRRAHRREHVAPDDQHRVDAYVGSHAGGQQPVDRAPAVPHDRFDLRGRGHRRAGVAHHPHLLVGQQVGVTDGDPGAEHSLVVQPLERGTAGEDPLTDVQVHGDVELLGKRPLVAHHVHHPEVWAPAEETERHQRVVVGQRAVAQPPHLRVVHRGRALERRSQALDPLGRGTAVREDRPQAALAQCLKGAVGARG